MRKYRKFESSIVENPSNAPNATTTLSGLLDHCSERPGLTDTILLAEDITAVEHVVDLLALLGSTKDAYTVAHALMLHIAAAPPHSGHTLARLAQAAVAVLRNAKVLYDCDHIVALLGTVPREAGVVSRDDKHWRLLSSFFGLVLQGSTGANLQHALKLCHTAAYEFGTTEPLEIFDWRYLVLITNLKHAANRFQYDVDSVWRTYFNPRRRNVAISNIGGYVEGLMMWCTVALDDVDAWNTFNAFSDDLWVNTVNPADITELECKTLFCYLYRCLNSNSHVEPHSICHLLLREALAGFQQHLNITTWEALNAITRVLMHNNYQPYSDHNRSNLVNRALCRLQAVRSLRPVPCRLTTSGWVGSSISATFLETLAQNYCHPYRFSDSQYESCIDAQVRNFLEHNLALKFSMNAFMRNPLAVLPTTNDLANGPAASLVELIMFDRSST